MSKYTEGPWMVDVDLSIRENNKPNSDMNVLLAKIDGPKKYNEAKANAQLIAAAPELLEAVKELLEEKESWRSIEEIKKANKLEKAIKKAEGDD